MQTVWRRGRLPHPSGLLNLAALLAIVLSVLALALRANVSPPAIAAFAPVVQQHLQAPSEQGSAFGTGPGGAGGGGVPPGTPAPAPSPPADAVFLHCVGDPPRQIEDPQSPPCVPYWAGDNGGRTWRGVEDATIKVTYMQFGDFQLWSSGQVDAITNFFNKRFEFYGRHIVLDPMKESNGASGQQADADTVAEQHQPFAATHDEDSGGLEYHLELARKGVVSDFGFEANPDEPLLESFGPYLWSYTMSATGMLAEMGNWYCAELNGRPASHAGAPLNLQMRKLGVVYNPFDPNLNTPFDSLYQALGRCGVKPYFIDGTQSNNANTAAVDLDQHHVTSVMCFCQGIYFADGILPASSGQGYQPEWLESSYGDDDTNQTFHFVQPPPDQAAHTFGLAFEPRQEPYPDNPPWWAMKEGDPNAAPPQGMNDIYGVNQFYRSLLLLAAGFQMAGPHLTPSTFAAGLGRTVFPNPVTKLQAGAVDFFAGSHAMTTDAAEWYWDQRHPSVYAAQGDVPQGNICYVDGGVRHGITDWTPATEDRKFFDGTCP